MAGVLLSQVTATGCALPAGVSSAMVRPAGPVMNGGQKPGGATAAGPARTAPSAATATASLELRCTGECQLAAGQRNLLTATPNTTILALPLMG